MEVNAERDNRDTSSREWVAFLNEERHAGHQEEEAHEREREKQQWTASKRIDGPDGRECEHCPESQQVPDTKLEAVQKFSTPNPRVAPSWFTVSEKRTERTPPRCAPNYRRV